jgi:hypothetical protein
MTPSDSKATVTRAMPPLAEGKDPRMLRSTVFFPLFMFLSASTAGCGESVPDGRILVKNDSGDKEYNIVDVSGGGASFSLSPGDTRLLPKGTSSFSMSRAYRDHTKYYSVECPRELSRGIAVKLIDVHVNRIAGGCRTVSASKG